jgi:hypothetical protein
VGGALEGSARAGRTRGRRTDVDLALVRPVAVRRPERGCNAGKQTSRRKRDEKRKGKNRAGDARQVPQPVGMCAASRTRMPPVKAAAEVRRTELRVPETVGVVSTRMIAVPEGVVETRPADCCWGSRDEQAW